MTSLAGRLPMALRPSSSNGWQWLDMFGIMKMQAPRLSDGRGRICLTGGPCRACVTGAVGEHAEPVTTTFSPLAAARPWRGSF
jgi:hypothetical protein